MLMVPETLPFPAGNPLRPGAQYQPGQHREDPFKKILQIFSNILVCGTRGNLEEGFLSPGKYQKVQNSSFSGSSTNYNLRLENNVLIAVLEREGLGVTACFVWWKSHQS